MLLGGGLALYGSVWPTSEGGINTKPIASALLTSSETNEVIEDVSTITALAISDTTSSNSKPPEKPRCQPPFFTDNFQMQDYLRETLKPGDIATSILVKSVKPLDFSIHVTKLIPGGHLSTFSAFTNIPSSDGSQWHLSPIDAENGITKERIIRDIKALINCNK
jgi:hypothetical protein